MKPCEFQIFKISYRFLTETLMVARLWELSLLFSQLHFDFLRCYLLLHH